MDPFQIIGGFVALNVDGKEILNIIVPVKIVK
jgi:hypothetical protein